MITRVVKMHFREEACTDFEALFSTKQGAIRQMPGCRSVELLKVTDGSSQYFTISLWADEASLEQYRASSFFKETWKATKALFAGKAEAWTLESCSGR